MLGRTERPNRNFAVLRAGILRDAPAVIGAVNIHFAAAVGAVHQAGQRVGLAPAVRVAPHVAPDALYIVKGRLIDDGLMRVLKNRLLAFIDIVAFLVLEMLAGFEVDCVAEIFPFLKDVHDGRGTPAVNILESLPLSAHGMPRQPCLLGHEQKYFYSPR